MIIPVIDSSQAGKMSYSIDQLQSQLQGQGSQPQQPAQPAQAQPQAQNQRFGDDASRATVREYIQKLMDVTRVVPDTAAKKGGPRGSPGSFAKLSDEQVNEFISAIIYGATLFSPKNISPQQQWALIAAEISIESAFTPGTSGINPGDNSKVSVGPLQLTLGIWDDIIRQYADVPNLIHYDGSPWNIKETTRDMYQNSIFESIIAALWCITEQGRRGCPDWLGAPDDGPMPKTWKNSQLAWVIGINALKSGGDLAGQKDAYIASETTDLNLLGFDASLLDTSF